MIALAYVWVEHCRDVAGCGTSLFQDKYFLCVVSATVFCLMNCDEHVECFDECIFFHYIYFMFYTSMYVCNFNEFYITLLGLDFHIGDSLNDQICPRLL